MKVITWKDRNPYEFNLGFSIDIYTPRVYERDGEITLDYHRSPEIVFELGHWTIGISLTLR